MVGQLIAGRYELHELVGSGGMSNVFRAHDRLLERSVAIKVLHEQFSADEDYVERFRREARSVAQLAHPNIVTVIDRGEEDGRQYIVFEYVEGANLKGLVANGALPVEQALRYGLQIAGALDFAHKRGLVHRDVKPQNVLLNEEGEPKVTDFGIARSLDVQGVTQTGTVLGTSDYIAPEQARGQRVDQKTDIYSLGIVLYELLTGEVPYEGDNFVAVAMQHVNGPIPSVLDRRRDVPVRLDHAVERAMAKDPEDRFESMEELIDELERCLGELGSPEAATRIVRPPRRPRAKHPRRKIPVLPILLLALAAAAVAGGAYLWLGGPTDVPVLADEASPEPIRLAGVGAHDPEGTGGEHDREAPNATDRNRDTTWSTEDYTSFTKSGVGLLLRAQREVGLSQVTVTTGSPGFRARIKGGASPGGPFVNVSDEEQVGEQTTFEVDTDGKKYRYYLVWLRLPRLEGGQAEINEVTART
ncbi:MAG: serine/threonine protein kinase [Actinobacteria bacterium]|nr:serine/threonine protein kinase [Actinomycetota bacterium]